MATISIFQPSANNGAGGFRSWTIPPQLATTDLLLLNVVIELKMLAHYAQLSAPQPTDEQSDVRNDIVNAP